MYLLNIRVILNKIQERNKGLVLYIIMVQKHFKVLGKTIFQMTNVLYFSQNIGNIKE